jgi:hypothetical protein
MQDIVTPSFVRPDTAQHRTSTDSDIGENIITMEIADTLKKTKHPELGLLSKSVKAS